MPRAVAGACHLFGRCLGALCHRRLSASGKVLREGTGQLSERRDTSAWLREVIDEETSPAAAFRTPHWRVVLRAADGATPESAQALEALCRNYWYPLYVFVRR